MFAPHPNSRFKSSPMARLAPSQPQPQPQQQQQPQEHTDLIHDTQFNYYGNVLATASSDRSIGIYSCRAGVPLHRISTLNGHDGPVWMVAWAHPRFGNILASASFDQHAIIWKESPPDSGNWRPVHVINIHEASVNAVAWAPDEFGPILATASSDGTVAVTPYCGGWHESIKLSNNSNHIAHAMGASSVSFAPFKKSHANMMVLASGGCDGQVRLWAATCQDGSMQPFELLQVLDANNGWVRDVTFCPASNASRYLLLASCGQDKRITLYRKYWDQLAKEMEGSASPQTAWDCSVVHFDEPVWRLSWAPSGELLVATTADSQVFVVKEGVDFSEPWSKIPLAEYK